MGYIPVIIETEALASKMEGATSRGRRPILTIQNPRTTIERSAGRNPREIRREVTYRLADHITT